MPVPRSCEALLTEVDLTTEERIKSLARELGFDLCGIAEADPVPGLGFFEGWLKKGLDGPLGYLKKHREARANPGLVLPGVRSVICVARGYSGRGACPVACHHVVGKEGTATGLVPHPPLARVASYAQGEDYHVALKRDLESLSARIREELLPRADFRAVTDSAPVLERSFAQAAGLGSIGKNSCLIHEQIGSFFLLGEILTTADLEPDAAATEDPCGSCTACLDACPTGALVEPGVLDAARCVSTLTLEQKGVLPEELLPGMENWIAGCDICQEVCPWNQEKRRSDRAEERRSDGATGDSVLAYSLSALLGMTLPEIRALFKGRAVLRAKPAMLMRNALVAAGNSGDSRLRSLASAWKDHEDPGLAQAARWALERLALSEKTP